MKSLTPYWQIMRMHRPIGTLLLLWPTLTALLIAGEGQIIAKWWLIFALGVFIMRACGCVMNDLADNEFDGHVARTKDRPLVTGALNRQQAKALIIGLLGGAFVLACMMPLKALLLAMVGAGLAGCYPFMKRITHYPQLILGFAFAWGIPMAFAAQNQPFTLAGVLFFIATYLWIVAFDTLYAMADIEDDVNIGVKSTAIAFGRFDKVIVFSLQLSMLGLLTVMGQLLDLGTVFYGSLVVALGFFIYQQWLIRHRSPANCLKAFLNNQWVGLVVLVGVFIGWQST